VWWVGSKPHDVYLGTRAFAVCRGADKLAVQSVEGSDAVFGAFAGWLAEGGPRRRLRLWLSGGLCRPFIVPVVPGVSSEQEWQQVAAAMAPAQCGLQGACRVWLSAPDKKRNARIAVAVQETLLQRLHETVDSAACKHRIASIRPWWSEVLQHALQREPTLQVLAVQDCDALTVLAGAGEGFDSASTLTPVFDTETAEAALARMLLMADVAPGQDLRARLTLNGAGHAAASMALGPLAEWSR